mgnify:CR=1 FL=1
MGIFSGDEDLKGLRVKCDQDKKTGAFKCEALDRKGNPISTVLGQVTPDGNLNITKEDGPPNINTRLKEYMAKNYKAIPKSFEE